jgi:hypothetical protein
MAVVFKIRDATGRVVMDRATDEGGVLVEVRTIAYGATGSVTYNGDARYAGRELIVIQVGPGSHGWSVDTSGGYPRLNWTARTHTYEQRTTTLLVFVR